jgi:hypothetical protein
MNKKKRAQLVKNAMARSQTVWDNTRSPVWIDEIQQFGNQALDYDSTTGTTQPVTVDRYIPDPDLTHIITLEGETRGMHVEGPYVVCTCGTFREGLTEERTKLLDLGRLAKQHAEETGHILRGNG